jgi:hypothetical protein
MLFRCRAKLSTSDYTVLCRKRRWHKGFHVHWTDDGDDIVWGDPLRQKGSS